MTRIHFLSLHPGDCFRYHAHGPLYRRAEDLGDKEDRRAKVERFEAGRWIPAGLQEYHGCMVIPADDQDQDQEARI